MATIVKDIESGRRYILLGSGYGAFRSERPGVLLGNLGPVTNEGILPMLCVCDERAHISWIKSSAAVVETIDGQDVQSLLGRQTGIPDKPES